MWEQLWIENYKSIDKLKLNLGRVNVFIGENGSGKTNILEAIATAAFAVSNELNNDFLATRYLRITKPQFQ